MAIVVFYNCYSAWLTHQIDQLYQDRQVTVNHASGVPEKDKGNILLKETLKDNNLVFLGSSELTSPVSENPKNMIPNNLYDGDASFLGHAYVQNALHAMNLGANTDAFIGKDVVIIESLQWFTGDDIDRDAFFSNFSELQMYEFLNNTHISDANRNYFCKRYIQLENRHEEDVYMHIANAASVNKIWNKINKHFINSLQGKWSLVNGELAFQESYIFARLYSGDSIADKILYQIMKPYFRIRFLFQKLKDKYDSYKWLKSLAKDTSRNIIDINWEKVYYTAENEGKEACTNNDIYVYDDYYTQYLEENWNDVRERDINAELLTSKEWEDFEFFLNVCDELGIKPYVVSMSTNGNYYDYIGIGKGKRNSLYNKIAQLSVEHDTKYLKTDDKEYEPYFYCDVMHLGWKGWPYVLQNILEHFSK